MVERIPIPYCKEGSAIRLVCSSPQGLQPSFPIDLGPSYASSLVLWFPDPPTLVNSLFSLHTPSPHSYTSSPLIPQAPSNYTHSFRTFFSPASLAHLFLSRLERRHHYTKIRRILPQLPFTHNHGLSHLSLFALIPYDQAYILNPKAPKG